MSPKCTHAGCDREATSQISIDGWSLLYEKCIFHCEKNNWFTNTLNGGQDWSKNADKVKTFWNAFQKEWVDEKKSDFSFFVFPEFTDDANFLKNPALRQLSDTEAKQTLYFNNAHFLSPMGYSMGFSGVTFTQDTDFSRATFTQDARFSGATFERRQKFLYSRFKQKAFFDKVSYKKSGQFRHCIFEGNAIISDIATPSRLLFDAVKFHGRFTVGTFGRKKVALKSLAFVDCIFEKDANVHIGNIVTDSLVLIRLRNLSSLVKLVSITAQKHFILHDSALSGAELNNITLPKSDGKEKWKAAIKIALSSFTKTAFNNVQWGDMGKIKADRDTFRQLKAANEDQKNYLQANEFYMMEMTAYRKEIKDKEWWRQERIDFWFGDFVSRFSNDWVRPIVILILITVPFYFASQFYSQYMGLKSVSAVYDNYIAYTKMIPCNFGMYLKSFAAEINSFLEFMNPLETKYKDHNTPALIWIPYKILSGLIIYQIIISLRRKTRH